MHRGPSLYERRIGPRRNMIAPINIVTDSKDGGGEEDHSPSAAATTPPVVLRTRNRPRASSREAGDDHVTGAEQQHGLTDAAATVVVVRQTSPRPRLCSMPASDRDSTWSSTGSGSVLLLLEDDRPVVPGVMVRAGTLDSLVETCIACFGESRASPATTLRPGPGERDRALQRVFESVWRLLDADDDRLRRGGGHDGGERKEHGEQDEHQEVADDNANFPYVFFLMHKWFATSDAVVRKLIDQFHASETEAPSSGGSGDATYGHRTRVCRAIRYWIRTFPMHFDMDPGLAAVLHDFRSLVADLQLGDNLADLLDLSKVPSYDWMRNISVRNPGGKLNRKVSLVFNHLQPEELAEHLTYLEHKAMRRIGFLDFKTYAQQGVLGDNAKLERSIALFNGLSQWIQCMVLSKTKPQQRAEVIVKFVHVAKRLQELQNFNTLMAVVGGLSHSALARLSKTLACVPPEAQKILQELTELLSSTSNFSNYRKALHDSKGFKIPILGVHMKDLISLNVALHDHVDDEVINFRKVAQLSLIFQELNQLQNSNPPIDVNMDLVNTLRLSLDLAYTEDEIYELSLAREPRTSGSPQSSPTKPAVFAEWAAGISVALDSDTIEKHVHAMVEAVYKNYDHDHDGYISQAEFEAIAGNFPFIDSFCVLDADQDGMISKEEMRVYFVRANSHLLKNGFKHDFHETTYFKPTFCAHCTGLLWGLIKQGYKCKECGINSHKHCKDLVVMECRRPGLSSSRCNSVASSDGAAMKSKLRHWKRQQKSNSQSSESAGGDPLPPASPRVSSNSAPNGGGPQAPFNDAEPPPSSLQPSDHSSAQGGSPGPSSCNGSPAGSDERRRSRSSVSVAPGSDGQGDGDQMSNLQERLVSAEEERDRLKAENETLRAQLSGAQEEIQALNHHMGEIRRQTVAFILRQMEALKIQKDTAV